MENIIRDLIYNILENRRDLLMIPLKQRAKFEGWLKFELAHALVLEEMENVEVETRSENSFKRADIKFESKGESYKIELKPPNTNWRLDGIENKHRPITKNINSIIHDTYKLNTGDSSIGIIAFVLFPLSSNDEDWKFYIKRISDETKLNINDEHCRTIKIQFTDNQNSRMLICVYKTKKTIFNGV
ncbi:MAG: hypothetical protein PHI22_04410 [Bacilli bacterium]|nr:hypothetical protein [Bacilli bacterium]